MSSIFDCHLPFRLALRAVMSCCVLFLCVHPLVAQSDVTKPTRPRIERLGTIDFGVTETTPVVFQDKLYRFEYINRKYHRARVPNDYFRFIDVATGTATSPFALGHVLGSAYADGKTMYTFGTRGGWGNDTVDVFWSDDLNRWESQTALHLKGWKLYNNSVCKGPNGYVMAIEAGEPAEFVGVRFTVFFARSDDLKTWRFLGPDLAWTKERYVGCPTIRFHKGQYYILYLERIKPADGQAAGRAVYQTHLVRTPDLQHWEPSPLNPVMEFSDADRRIRNSDINAEQQERIKLAPLENISDMDLVEHKGQVLFYYSWGSQQGIEYLAEGRYDGTLGQFFDGFFPEANQKPK